MMKLAMGVAAGTLLRHALVTSALSLAAVPAFASELPVGTDPVFVEAYESCMDGASGGLPPESRGWISHHTGNADAQAWNNWTAAFATLDDILGVGGLDLYGTIEVYAGFEGGTCEVTMQKPSRFIVAPGLNGHGFVGELEVGAED